MSCRRCCHRVAASVALALAAVLVFTAAQPSPARRAFTCAHRRQTGSPNFFPHGQEDGGGCSASGLCGRRPSALRSQLWGSEGCTVLLFPAFALNSPAHRVKTSNPGGAVQPSPADHIRLGGAVELTCRLPGGRQSLFMANPGATPLVLTPQPKGTAKLPPGWFTSVAISTAKMSMPSTTGWPAKTIPRATVSPSTRPRASLEIEAAS